MNFAMKYDCLTVSFTMCLFWACLGISKCTYIRLSLTGKDWKVRNANGSIQVGASVPGSVYTDLESAGVIKSPYYRFNDLVYRWVGNESWMYSKQFEVTTEMMERKMKQLRFEGLDTVARVSLNGHAVGETNNMFRKYIFDISGFIKEGSNLLEISFESPVLYAKRQADSYAYDVPPDCPGPQQKGECHFNFIRKEACSFSWDWGPAFPTMGIWKNVTLDVFSTSVFRTVSVGTHKVDYLNGSQWEVNGWVSFERSHPNQTIAGKLQVVMDQSVLGTYDVNLGPSESTYVFFCPIEKEVKLWWPNGHGDQPLYDVTVTFTAQQGDVVEVDDRVFVIGFRTVELVQEPVPSSDGLSLYFKINGVPIFMKGSNWIPADSFQERITEVQLWRLLTSAKLANMNMLRVWGGGVYESDTFYEIADRLGIMLWQDFMYACAMYPTNPSFLENVGHEIHHQVHRLRSHPCVAIWAGNNENEGGVDGFRNKPTWKRYYDDYVKLYISTIKDVVQVEDKDRPFVPSSPSNGMETQKEGWVAKNPQDELYGDVHHYDYTSDGWNWKVYPIPRFASEFGFESWCSAEALRPVSDVAEDWNINSKFVDHRQHHPDGNKQMMAELSLHLKPPNSRNQTQAFVDYIYLTQINQAMSIKTEAELYRRSQSKVKDGKGMTMGSLYWQLNDIWQGPTWASIEYGDSTKWKMLHSFARRFYNQTILSPFIEDSTVKLYHVEDVPASTSAPHHNPIQRSVEYSRHSPEGVVNMERRRSEAELSVCVRVFHWDALSPSFTQWITVPKPVLAAELVYQEDLAAILTKAKCGNVDSCFLHFSLTGRMDGPTNFLLLSNLTTAKVEKPEVTIQKIEEDSKDWMFIITLTTNLPAPFVWLEAEGIPGWFSDNGFLLVDQSYVLVFQYWETCSLKEFEEKLTVKSLMDVYET